MTTIYKFRALRSIPTIFTVTIIGAWGIIHSGIGNSDLRYTRTGHRWL